jgi:opacity protein-like surface antigen
MRKLTLLLGVVAAIAATLAVSAAANTRVVVQHNAIVTRHFAGLTDCQAYGYTFTFTGDYVVRRSDVQYFDDNGTLVEEVIWAHFVGTDTNDTTGKSLRDTGERHITFDYVNNTVTESGVLRHITVPGSGIVLHESGRLIVSLVDESVIFMAGPHQLLTGDEAEFCAALADP